MRKISMKIIILFVLLIALFTVPAQAEFNSGSWVKIGLGVAMAAAGSVMIYDGFSLVNAAQPYVSMSDDWSWSKDYPASDWLATGSGTVRNSGNVDFNSVVITVKYRDSAGTLIAVEDVISVGNLAQGSSVVFNSTDLNTGTDEPITAYLSYDADFDEVTRLKNAAAGGVGIFIATIGSYLVIDTIFGITDMLMANDADVSIYYNENKTSVMAYKSF